MAHDKNFSLKSFEDQVKKGVIRGRSEREAARVLYDVRPLTRDEDEMRLVPSQHWNPEEDITLEEYLSMKKDEEKRKKGLSTKAKEFVPGKYSIRSKSKKTRSSRRSKSRKARKSSRKSRKARKSSRKSRKARKSLRKSRKARKSLRKSRKARKSLRKSRKARKSLRKSKSKRKSRRSGRSRRKSMGKRERACKDLLKEKVGINLKEYESGRYSSRQQAIAVSYSQVKKMKPSCGKYFKRKDN